VGIFYDDKIFGSDHHIRIRFLAAVLRGDECDISCNRVPETNLLHLNLKELPGTSEAS